jgi:hypothetical protein
MVGEWILFCPLAPPLFLYSWAATATYKHDVAAEACIVTKRFLASMAVLILKIFKDNYLLFNGCVYPHNTTCKQVTMKKWQQFYFLEHNTIHYVEIQPTFQRNIQPPTLRLKSNPSKKLARRQQTEMIVSKLTKLRSLPCKRWTY